ncbi:MAG: ATP-binding protein [Bacteroidetes bacterium]|nr:ATP-binding protein [Bacteroidota bacterium]
MKIRKITFENHFLFGNLSLDFTNKNGDTVDTIIIAGENGVGKSLLLEVLYKFSTFSALEKNEKLYTEIELSQIEIGTLSKNGTRSGLFKNLEKNNILQIQIDFSISNIWNRMRVVNGSDTYAGEALAVDETRRIFMAIFSSAEINFSSNEIYNITALNIDNIVEESERSNSNLASEITQLFVDIQTIDATEFAEWGRENEGLPVNRDKIDIRINRFANAFKFIFPEKKYKTIKTKNNVKQVIFEENGREMGINELSSGEKQIVFRGSFLLKNKETTRGALVLIDEPEISMHPTWQLKILTFFKKLFTDNDGLQTSQLIVTTHSPFVIHNSNRENDKVVVLKKDDKGKIVVSNEPEFYGWTNEKIVQEAFNVNYHINSDKTIILLEGETDEKYFNKALEVFEKRGIGLEFRWIGKLNGKGNPEYTGVKALDNAKNHYTSNPSMLKNKTILLYDSDTNKFEEDLGNLFVRRMEKNEVNTLYKKGIENLLFLPSNFSQNDFYKERIKVDDYGAESLIRELDKTKLCSHICDVMDKDNQKVVLKKIEEEIEKLLKLIR